MEGRGGSPPKVAGVLALILGRIQTMQPHLPLPVAVAHSRVADIAFLCKSCPFSRDPSPPATAAAGGSVGSAWEVLRVCRGQGVGFCQVHRQALNGGPRLRFVCRFIEESSSPNGPKSGMSECGGPRS